LNRSSNSGYFTLQILHLFIMDVKTLITLPVALVSAVFLAVSLGIVSWGVEKPIKKDYDACIEAKNQLCVVQIQSGLVGNWASFKQEGANCDSFDEEKWCKDWQKSGPGLGVHCKAKCSKGELKVTAKTQYRSDPFGYVGDGQSIAAATKKDSALLKVDDLSFKCWRQGPAIGLIVAGLSSMVFVAALAYVAAQNNDTLVYIVAIVFAVAGMIAAVLGVSFAIAANNPLTSCKYSDGDFNKAVKTEYKEFHKSYVGGAGAVGLVGAILSIFVAVLAIVAFFLRPSSGSKGVTTTIHPGPN
jgi:hypothetical protein